MTAITLAQADRLIDAILARGAELDCRPLAVIVVEPGCKVKAFKKEDGSSAPASGAGVGPKEGCPCPNVSVPVAAAAMPPAAAAPSMSP